MITSLFLYGVIPIGLIVAALSLIRKRSDQEAVERRTLLFLAWTAAGLVSMIMLLHGLLPPMGSGTPSLLTPALAGVIAALLLHLQDWRKLRHGERTALLSVAAFLAVLMPGLLIRGMAAGDGRVLDTLLLGLSVLAAAVLIAVVWSTGKDRSIPAAILALLYMLVFNILEGGSLPFFDATSRGWISVATVAVYLTLPGLVIAATMRLASSAFGQAGGRGEGTLRSWRAAAVRLLFVAALLASFFYTIVWLSIWDGTDDGIRGILVLMWSTLAAIAGSMIVFITSAGWRRWSGLVLAIMTIGLVRWAVVFPRDRYRPYDLTEARAAHIQEAIEGYHARTSHYPLQLADLLPAELWRIPRPMIMPAEAWCYQGGSDFYRLGAIHREHWSSPYLSIKIYAASGNVPEERWACDEKLADLLSRTTQGAGQPPEAAPMPTSPVAVGRTVIEPVLWADSLVVGDWSADGRYLVFGQTRPTGQADGPLEIDVQFLDAGTGEVCPSPKSKWRAGERSDGLTAQHLWLPDGRLLYVSDLGGLAVMTPCVEGVQDVTDHYPVQFTQVASRDMQNERAVLKNTDSYWVLDEATLEAHPITDVPPAPAEDQRDWIAWSPDGTRLAISRMNGQAAGAGAAIFIIDQASGAVERRIPLSTQAGTVDGPVVDWLSGDELLVQFVDALLILDLSSDPVRSTDLVHDVFLLDLAYPVDFSSMDMARHTDPDGYSIALRANHPHNQSVYLYESQTRQVRVFRHTAGTLLFFPDGQWLQAPKGEDIPAYKDEYEMVWMDHPQDEFHLVVEGHVPRDQPQIFPRYLPVSSRLVFHSSQGISLISLPDGATLQFWELAGHKGSPGRVLVSPQGNVLVVLVEGVGLYRIPLTQGGGGMEGER